MGLFNKHGYLLYPTKGGDIVHDSNWMYTSKESKSYSEKKFYRFSEGDDNHGAEALWSNFETHAKMVSPEAKAWEFSRASAIDIRNNPVFIAYRNKWNEKWVIVREILCGP